MYLCCEDLNNHEHCEMVVCAAHALYCVLWLSGNWSDL